MTRPNEDIELENMKEREKQGARPGDDEFHDAETTFMSDFDRLRQDAASEFDRETLSGMTIDEKGGYRFNYGNPDQSFDTEEYNAELKMEFDYVGIREVFSKLYFYEDLIGLEGLPNYQFLRDNHFMEDIELRTNAQGELNGISYRMPGSRKFVEVIVRDTGARRFRFTINQKNKEALNDFKVRLQDLKEIFAITPTGMSEREANRHITGSENGSSISGSTIWNRDDLAQKYRRDTFKELKAKMAEYYDEILSEFSRNTGIRFEPTEDGTSFIIHATNLMTQFQTWSGIMKGVGLFPRGGRMYMTENSRL